MVRAVSAAVTLAGINTTQFGPVQSASFTYILASTLGAANGAARVTQSYAAARRRRSLLSSSTGVTVAFSVTVDTTSAARAVTTGILGLSTNAAFLLALQNAGIPTTGVTLAIAPTTTATFAGSAVAPAATSADVANVIANVEAVLGRAASTGNNASSSSPLVSQDLANSLGTAASLLNSVVGDFAVNGTDDADALRAELLQQRESSLTLLAESVALPAGGAGFIPEETVTATAVAIASLTRQPVQLTPSAQRAALAALAALAAASDNVTAETAQVMVLSLDNVVTAATGSGRTTEAEQRDALRGVLTVVAALAQGQGEKLASASDPPVVWVTDNLQVSVWKDDPSAAGPNGTLPRVYREAFSAPGAPSRFDPLPSGALASAGGGAVLSHFMHLEFDPYSVRRSGSVRGMGNDHLDSLCRSGEVVSGCAPIPN